MTVDLKTKAFQSLFNSRKRTVYRDRSAGLMIPIKDNVFTVIRDY